MTAGDLHLLALVRRGLAEPFADPVDLGGGWRMARETARAVERALARLKIAGSRIGAGSMNDGCAA